MARERNSEAVLIGIIVALVVVAVVAVVVAISFATAPAAEQTLSPTSSVASPIASSSSSSSGFAAQSAETSSDENTTYKQGTGSPSVVASDGTRVLSEKKAYELLKEYYDLAGDYDKRVTSCSNDFNEYGLKEDKSARSTRASSASTLKQRIKSSWDDLKKVELPFMSKNTAALPDMLTLYECLYNRIDVIDRAWKISLTYEKPEEHKREVLEPITADQVNGQNRYYTQFKELYPTVKLVKP